MERVTDPARTLELLRSECETCGAWGVFTGRTVREHGMTYAVVRCPDEGVDFPVWSQRGDEVLQAYERARSRARPDVDVVLAMAGRLSRLTRPPEPTADDVRRVLDQPLDPAPLGATELRIDGGWLPTVELVWARGSAVLTRADLDGLLGVGRLLPRTGPGAAHVVAHDVPAGAGGVVGGPAQVVVFARSDELPGPETDVVSLLLRVDLPPT